MPSEALTDLLTAGPLPPRAAVELGVKLVDAMNGQPPVGEDVLEASRVSLVNGVPTLDRRGARTVDEAETRRALGALLVHVLTGTPWKPKKAKRQLEDLRGTLSFWPDGGSLADLIEDLVVAEGGFSGVRSRLDAAGKRAAGSDLNEWAIEAKLRISGELDQPAPRAPSVDDLTANIPAGALAKRSAPAAPAAPVLVVTPPAAPARAAMSETPAGRVLPIVGVAAALGFLALLVLLVVVLAALAI